MPFDLPGEARSSIENPTVPVSAENFAAFFGVGGGKLPRVSLEAALQVPAFAGAVNFLSSTLANLPLHAFKDGGDKGPGRVGGDLQRLLNEAPNSEWSSFGMRKYAWQQVFTGGRGLIWIEFKGRTPVGLWPMEPGTTIGRVNGKRVYRAPGHKDPYPASEVIDLAFMLKANQLNHWGPLQLLQKALQLAIAMNDYGSGFFAGGGVPPLALSGPLPQGPQGMQRAMGEIHRAIEAARQSDKPIFPMPPGHDLKQVGYDPAKGQMVEARTFQIQEIARVFCLPPAFLQDLSRATFSNVEQQDLNLTKHTVAHWSKAFEDEANLKLFGATRNSRYVEHSLDGLMRGDFKSRVEAMGRAIQTGQLKPNEARALENRPPVEGGDVAYIQGATVPLGTVPTTPAAPGSQSEPPPADPDNNQDNEDQANEP